MPFMTEVVSVGKYDPLALNNSNDAAESAESL
jgi:hypothetical protein